MTRSTWITRSSSFSLAIDVEKGRAANDPVLRSGHLKVGDAHELFFEEWGNPNGATVVVLHGGPGGYFDVSFKRLFSAERHRVILFDQRGSGRSRPTGTLANNTTADLIEDINHVRVAMGIAGPMNLAGGSWGSTLALLYAQEHPANVKELMLWSTFLATKAETRALFGKWARDRGFPHPRAWKQFIDWIPRHLRRDPAGIIAYVLTTLNSMDAVRAWELAVAYAVYDLASCNSPAFNEASARKDAEDNPNVVHSARILAYYLHNNCFVTEGQILSQMRRIRSIKANVVHGVDDWCTRPEASNDLKRAYGANMTVRFVKSGHLRSDPEMTKALREVASELS